MLTKKKQSLWARMALTLLLAMAGMVAKAQTFVVVDKQGNKITYDASKIDKVTFQEDPPGFTVHEVKEESSGTEDSGTGDPGTGQGQEEPIIKETTFAFAEVVSFSGDPVYLFAHPDTVYVDGEGENFKFQFRANVEYTYNFGEHDWISYVSPVNGTDSLLFKAEKNPMTTKRKGFIAFASKDEQIKDTIWVKQAAKLDSRYIDIDWTKTTLDSYDEASGKAQITFTGDVPVMGDYDVVLLPKDDSYVIRLIDDVRKEAGSKTVNITTRQGLMGNLFKGTKFKLATEAGAARTRGDISDDEVPVYLPTKVEMMTEGESVELFNADKAGTRAVDIEKEFVSWEYNEDGLELWSSGVQSLSWDKLNFNIGLKGLFSFDFGDIPFEKVRMGDLQNLKITLEGGFNMEMILKYAVASEVKYEKEWTLKENAIPNLKYTFMVGTVPVYITVGADLMASISLGASGEASVTTGVTASTKVSYGVEWDAEKGLSKISECEKSLELVGPDLDINAHAEASASAYPKIEIGIYKVLCPTISPMPYLKAEADGRLVDNSKVAWNAGISTGVDLGLGLCLDLFFWKKDLGEIDPINVFDLPLVSLPDEIELQNEKEEQMLINNQKEVKYHVTNKNYLTGTSYNAPGVLVKFEAEGGEISSEYDYTDKNGDVSVYYTPTAGEKGGVVKAEVVLGAEPEKEEDAMKADDYAIEAIDYRLTGGSYTIPEGETSVEVTFQLEKYSSKTATWAGEQGRTVSFEATNGTVSPSSGVTDSNGKVTVTFTAGDNFSEGSVTASVSGSDPSSWAKTTAATITAGAGGGGDEGIIDDDLKKAKSKGENVYVIEDKDGKTEDFSYSQEWSDWKVNEDGNISFQLENADENGSTLGGFWGTIPLSLVGTNTAITQEFLQQNSGFYVNFGHYISTETSNGFDAYVMSKGGEVGGNIKTDGSSKFLIREVKSQQSKTRTGDPDYAGKYEFVYYLVFTNQTYNQETQQMETGDDFIVYGNGILNKHVPTVNRYELSADKDWVKVGGTTKVTLDSYSEKEATWDWNDVELVGQSATYSGADKEDLGFFTWDASTQTLTSAKSNDNKDVYLKFALKSKPGVTDYISVKTGEGWKYTMITPSQDTFTYTGYGYLSFSFDWTPKASEDEKFDFNSIEIDPETNPNGYFSIPMSYASQGWPLYVDNAPKGEYNVRIRIKSNHDVNCTIKVISELDE
ncbi:MAG: hypothetical protein IKN58_02750 [Prevotella sp.]|nr:hypothetical protein [Prevotella sp.]